MTRQEILTLAEDRKATGQPLTLYDIELIAEGRYQVAMATCRVQRASLSRLKQKLIQELRAISNGVQIV